MGSDFQDPEHEFTARTPTPWRGGGPWYTIWKCTCRKHPSGTWPWNYLRATTEGELAAKLQALATHHS